jgi:hypothetical protein
MPSKFPSLSLSVPSGLGIVAASSKNSGDPPLIPVFYDLALPFVIFVAEVISLLVSAPSPTTTFPLNFCYSFSSLA